MYKTYIILPPFQNDWWIVDARFKMKWSIIHNITTGTSTILLKIAQWESYNHSGAEGALFHLFVHYKKIACWFMWWQLVVFQEMLNYIKLYCEVMVL